MIDIVIAIVTYFEDNNDVKADLISYKKLLKCIIKGIISRHYLQTPCIEYFV